MRLKILLGLTFCAVALCSERDFLNNQERLEQGLRLDTSKLKKNSVYLCRKAIRTKYLTNKQDPTEVPWDYNSELIALKVYQNGKVHGLEVTPCENRDTINCRNYSKATIYFRDKIRFDSPELVKITGLPREIMFSTKTDERNTAFDTFTKDSTLTEDFVDVFTFGYSIAYQKFRDLGPGAVVRKIQESSTYCFK